MKEPQPGEYWQHKIHTKDRAYFIGRTPNGEMVWQCEDDTIQAGNVDWSHWQHLQDCTGFNWQPEVFPKYYLPSHTCTTPTVFHRRDSKTKTVGVIKDGSEWNWKYQFGCERYLALKEITEAEALALLDKPKESSKRIPVRLWTHRNALKGSSCRVIIQSRPIDDCNVEIHSDDNGGWYIEVPA